MAIDDVYALPEPSHRHQLTTMVTMRDGQEVTTHVEDGVLFESLA
jgi:hypothetical protein